MGSKKFLLLLLVISLTLLLGCSNSEPGDIVDEVDDQLAIEETMSAWADAWSASEDAYKDSLSATMISENIMYDDASYTFDEYVNAMEEYRNFSEKSIDLGTGEGMTINGNQAHLTITWKLENASGVGVEYEYIVYLVKDNDDWYISKFEENSRTEFGDDDGDDDGDDGDDDTGDPIEEYDGYVGFETDGNNVSFNDVDDTVKTIYFPGDVIGSGKVLTIEGEDSMGNLIAIVTVPDPDNDGNYVFERVVYKNKIYEEGEVDFELLDFDEGEVKGEFNATSEEGQEITGGKFYINHEFNAPFDFVVEEPEENADVDGLVTVSGTVKEDSGLYKLGYNVLVTIDGEPLEGSESFNFDEISDGLYSWEFEIDFSKEKYSNGEHSIYIQIADTYYNYSEEIDITVNVNK
ncbi:MAG: hypothetical protein ACOCQW_01015 [Halanaerobiaceae bacterium]